MTHKNIDSSKKDWLYTADTKNKPIDSHIVSQKRYSVIKRLRALLIILAIVILVSLFYFLKKDEYSFVSSGLTQKTNLHKTNKVEKNLSTDVNKKNDVDISKNIKSGLSMFMAKYSGLDSKYQPFNITADKASRLSDSPDVINLENPMADILLKDGSWVAVSGKKGSYMQKDMQLFLSENVKLFHDSGYELLTDELHIDLKKAKIITNSHVKGQGPLGVITATGLEFGASHNKIIFMGPAKLTLFVNSQNILGN